MISAVVFAYSEVGARCTQVLLQQNVRVPLLFTHRDDPHETKWYASVADLAARHGIEMSQSDEPNDAACIARARERTRDLTGQSAPDFVFSFYYRSMLSPAWLELPSRGALNMHGSLLPKYRGRAPVHWAILNGEIETGATLHYMLPKPDAGAVVDAQSVPIGPEDNALEVSQAVAAAAAHVLERSLPRLIDGTAQARELDLQAGSYFGRRTPEDGRIDWHWGAKRIHDLIRAVAPPFPGAFFDVRRARILVPAARLDALQAEASAPQLTFDFASGAAVIACSDGRRLHVPQLLWNGSPLSSEHWPPEWPRQSSLPLLDERTQ